MAQVRAQPASEPAVQTSPAQAIRLFFVDHLRAALIILVVLHHVAMVYGGIEGFYYLEPPFETLSAFLVAMAFVLLNQAWFMGALFLVAGYFAPGSFDRKGTGGYLKGRFIRLGIPLLVWYFVLNPISEIGYFLMPTSLTGLNVEMTWETFWQLYPELLGLGPLWFVALLIVFSLGYAAWRWLTRNRETSAIEASQPTYLQIGAIVLVIALLTYLVRIFIPIGRTILDFPTLAYLPQYLGFFILGAFAYRRDWFRTIPGKMGAVGFVVAIVATLTLFAFVYLGVLQAIDTGVEPIPQFGNGTWRSGVYALWDSLFAVGMVLAALTFFRRFFNRESQFGSFLAQQSYAVYIIHVPIIVYSAYLLRDIDLGPFLKFGLVSMIVLAISFGLAYLIRKIPGVAKVV